MFSHPELFDPRYVFAKRHRIIPYLLDDVGGRLRCRCAKAGWYLTDNERRLARLKNSHSGERAFIIGNGPSLRMDDLERLKGEITFASNKIFLAFDEIDWRPTFYVVEDGLAIGGAVENLHYFEDSTKLFPFRRYRETRDASNAIYFNYRTDVFYPGEPAFSEDLLESVIWGATVTYTMMQFAVYMGFSEIYLLGVDFHFPGTETPEVGDQQFTVSGKDCTSHHFHSNYYSPGDKMYPPNVHLQEKSYQSAAKAVERLGVKMFNATRGGKLEIFPRVDFDQLLDPGKIP